ncbi:MAG: hypothetical protein JKX68_06085 [Flavobacteriales bacterium]|nr:hypothetical protein [Flavobacteriales bacterium]
MKEAIINKVDQQQFLDDFKEKKLKEKKQRLILMLAIVSIAIIGIALLF